MVARVGKSGRRTMEIDQEFMNLVEKIIFYEEKNRVVTRIKPLDKLILKRVATKTAIRIVKLALKTIIGVRTVASCWGTRPIPSVCVLSLSQEQIFQGKTPETLLSFFQEPRFDNHTDDILIETKSFRFINNKLKSFKRSIPIHIFLNSLENSQRVEALNLFTKATKRWVTTSDVKMRANLKVMYFLLELAVWYTIRAEKITLITTQSTMNNLPAAFEISNSSFHRKMFWYSTNSQPILKKGLTLERPILSKSLIRNIDMHYVWDRDSKNFLESDGITKVKAVGSILFVKPESISRVNSDFNIAYFDVTPFERANTYYTSERMCANLSQIVEITSQLTTTTKLRINLLVKPKREWKGNHAREYIQMLTSYERDGKLKVLKAELNIYGIANSVDCIIGIPFTSPVVVGRELATPATFVDLYKDDYQLPETHNGFQVISDHNQLKSWLEKCLQPPSTFK
jgi:hypothetical protein